MGNKHLEPIGQNSKNHSHSKKLYPRKYSQYNRMLYQRS